MTRSELEQLENIVYYGPVASGDLIGKSLRDSLMAKGFVDYLPGNNKSGARDGIRIGGWVATDSGRKAYANATGYSLLKEATNDR